MPPEEMKQPEQPKGSERLKHYEAPELKTYGSIEQLTQGGGAHVITDVVATSV